MDRTVPFVVVPGATLHRGVRLPRVHAEFDEHFIQELLAKHPDLLPVEALRSDIGTLVCIGREVPTRDSGTIDNLYLTSTGYVVLVETKLWRNPESRREVLSQVLDYVKDVVTRDFDWLASVWSRFCTERNLPPEPLLNAMRKAAPPGEFEEAGFIDRVHTALERGHVIALIVGDGIETRLQQLVGHLCQDSAHLRYSLGLVSLGCYKIPGRDDLVLLPELVQEVEPVQRAYVRIEVAESLKDQINVVSVLSDRSTEARGSSKPRSTLSEDQLYEAISQAIGPADTERVRRFVQAVSEVGVEPDFKQAALMLKIPDPEGEALGASLFAIERSARVYNPDHGWNQVRRWGWPEEKVDRTIGAYWRRLHSLDGRFAENGISHLRERDFIPLQDVVHQLDGIAAAIAEASASIHREAANAP